MTSGFSTWVAPALAGAARVALGGLWLHEGITKYRAHFGAPDILLLRMLAHGRGAGPAEHARRQHQENERPGVEAQQQRQHQRHARRVQAAGRRQQQGRAQHQAPVRMEERQAGDG